MNRSYLRTVVTSGLLVAAGAVGASLALPGAVAQPEPPDMEEMMRVWQEAATPGPMHESLAEDIGTWDVTSKMYMQGPDAPPMESRGVSEIRWIIDGRWLIEEFKGEMMGEPTTGYSIMGYDNYKKQFVACWFDSMSTAMINFHGSRSADGKTLTMFGTMDEPMTGEKGKTVKFVSRTVDADTRHFEIQEVQYGEPFTVVQMTYTRRK